MMERRVERTEKMLIAAEEGGRWLVLDVHSFVTPDGKRWDAISGWGAAHWTPAQIEQHQAAEKASIKDTPNVG